MCSITVRSGVEPIGVSLQSDTDFSHIITRVQSNSLAARAGIEQDDCIISLNNISLLHISFEDVLYHLAKSRTQSKLNFLVAKRSYLLQSCQTHLNSSARDHLFPATCAIEKKRSSTLPIPGTLEQIFYKSADELLGQNQQQEKKRNEQDDRLSLKVGNNLNVTKRKKKHGQILDGIGPATGLRFSWSIRSEKTMDYSSIRSDLHGREIG